MPGPVGTVLQALYMLGIIASLPAIEGLRADVKVPAGKASIMTMGVIVIKPFESLPGLLGWLDLKLGKARSSRNYSTYYSHSNTIIVSPIYLNQLIRGLFTQ